MELETYTSLGIALLLGLLVGFQREWSENKAAGIRTFTLITLFGAIAALLDRSYGGWLLAAGAITTASFLVLGSVKHRDAEDDFGITTEIAAMVMYGVGAMTIQTDLKLAIVLGGITTILLHCKKPLHDMVRKIGKADLRAIMQFVVIGLVVLPLLPNETFGPHDVLNPYKIWFIVVLIVSLSLSSYIAYRLFRGKIGNVLVGILGGLISSTATTVSFAKQARQSADLSLASAFVILVASTILYIRVLIEIGFVSPMFLRDAAPPFIALTGFMSILALLFFIRIKNVEIQNPTYENPAQLKTAVLFGLLYAIIGFSMRAADKYLGGVGLNIVAILSGLTDVDAVTLSTAELVNTGQLTPYRGWRVILIASLSNLIFKAVVAGFLGGRKLFKYIILFLGVSLVGGILILLYWPEEGFIEYLFFPAYTETV